ncbi:MAG: membrane protein insertion efficiency factor YidD [Verrucomicrobia bacterium]|nr:membrane protein insertion efficiency factor YidD [Verrucomicrobiota bacterium]
MLTALIALIRFYRRILSPLKVALFGPAARCRFSPTCSAYAIEVLQSWGLARGSWLALRRLCRCHPWGGCGYDPPPRRRPRTVSGRTSPSSAVKADRSA